MKIWEIIQRFFAARRAKKQLKELSGVVGLVWAQAREEGVNYVSWEHIEWTCAHFRVPFHYGLTCVALLKMGHAFGSQFIIFKGE